MPVTPEVRPRVAVPCRGLRGGVPFLRLLLFGSCAGSRACGGVGLALQGASPRTGGVSVPCPNFRRVWSGNNVRLGALWGPGRR